MLKYLIWQEVLWFFTLTRLF